MPSALRRKPPFSAISTPKNPAAFRLKRRPLLRADHADLGQADGGDARASPGKGGGAAEAVPPPVTKAIFPV